MKWYMNQLNQFRNTGIELDEYLDVSDLTNTSEIRRIPPVHIVGRGDFGSNKVTFSLKIQGTMILPCSRTLVDVEYPFNIETTETYLLSPSDYGYHDEEEIHYVEGELLDLSPMIKENILLEIPIQVFCDDNQVEGKAPQSGEGWEVISEEDSKNRIDPRLAALKNFFDDNKNK
ncbi:YceD family protein [Bacillus sp. Marseille-P3661]|uniref:YceD family protein n=1 Tax=Bacillus sp. Marseille-P3661 TaxID=1936234 RepID=UPI000C85996B|nr:DUF177 domain-containing protein [Bacillus sp. Marseille-P3661]